jgi:TetR/AcrR family transcriptional regulator, transcriptional repressor of bet genes
MRKNALVKAIDLFGSTETKSQQRMVQIAEAAIRSYASVGVEQTSFERLSKRCGVTRPLIHHYFKTKRELFNFSVKYIRALFQKLAIEAIQKEKTPSKQLEAYVGATFDWIRDFPDHGHAWKLFYYYCGIDKKMRALNTELSVLGSNRIAAILEAGVKAGSFKVTNPKAKAKTLQVMILGALMTATTEDIQVASFQKQFMKDCKELIGF